MFIVPEVRTAILRTAIAAALAIACTMGAIRTDSRKARIVLFALAIPITLFTLFGLFIISLDMQYGPR